MAIKLRKLRPNEGATKKKKRVGRGVGSGLGKTAGRAEGPEGPPGHHGARSAFEGGQTPLQRRLPKRGFRNPFRIEAVPSTSATLDSFDAGARSTATALREMRPRPEAVDAHQDPRQRRAHQEAHRHGPPLLQVAPARRSRRRAARSRSSRRPGCGEGRSPPARKDVHGGLAGFANISKVPELRRAVLFTLAMLAVYRIGVFVTIPGVDRNVMSALRDEGRRGLVPRLLQHVLGRRAASSCRSSRSASCRTSSRRSSCSC